MTDRRFVFGLFLVAFLFRLAAASWLARDKALLPDSLEYLQVADNLLSGKGFALSEEARAKRPPVYPALLALPRGLFPGRIFPAQVLQAFLGGILCVLVWLVGRQVFSRATARWAAAICVGYPLLVYAGAAVLAETPRSDLLLLEILLLIRAKDRPALGFAAGIICGLGTLVHAGHALFPAAVALYRRGRFLPLYLLGALLIVGSWAVRNAAVLGSFVPLTTQSGYTLYESFGPEATGGTIGHRMKLPPREGRGEVEYDSHLRREALREIMPRRAFELALEKQRRFWSVLPSAEGYRSLAVYVATLAFLPVLAGFFVALLRWRRVPEGAGWILLPIVYTAALHAVFLGSIRYRLAVEPLLILLAVWGWSCCRGARRAI